MTKHTDTVTPEKIAIRVSVISIVINVVLTAGKLIAGIFAHSIAMVSDSMHSLSDVLSTFVVIAGVRMGGKAPDKEHLYGHERLESIAALLLAMILAATGLGIGYSGVKTIITAPETGLMVPGTAALIAALVSIVVKELLYHYTARVARDIDSDALMADAWHHRSDALSSVGSLLGIAGARLGVPLLDPIAAIAICVFIVKAAVDIFRDAVGKLTDRSCDDETISSLRRVILDQPEVMGIDLLRTRIFGNRIYVEVEVRADGEFALRQAHDMAHGVHDAVERKFPKVKHCTVHVNPSEAD